MSKSFQTFEEFCHCLLINLVKRQVPDKKKKGTFFMAFWFTECFGLNMKKIQKLFV